MSRKESAKSSTFLFCLLIFVFTCSEIQARKLDQICSSSCGDIKNISYPFRLKGDPSRCGYSEFELSCESNQTILYLDYFGVASKYYVKRISYDKSTITVADFNLANGSCSLPNSSFPSRCILPDLGDYTDYDLIYTVDSKKPFVYFVNCPRNPVNHAYTKVPCLNGNQSNVYVGYDSEIPEFCSFISKVPVHDSRNVENPSYEAFRKLLESGFDLGWSVECRNCSVGSVFGPKCIYTAGKFKGCTQYYYPNFFIRVLDKYYIYTEWIVYHVIQYSGLFKYRSIARDTELEIPWLGYYNYVILLIDSALVYAIMIRFILASILLVFLIHKCKTTLRRVDIIEKFLYNQQSWMPKRYSYHEIIAMTNHFKDKLGQGGFGSVYKGQLHTGCFIAVKMLENSKFSAEEFINEVSTIGRIHHFNVVQLLGFCSEGSKRSLVYEYMPNGSLDRHIFSKQGTGQSFSWEKLHEIALGTARGIEYLHGGCDVCILHFDIKPQNILLDHNFIPKVSDFGLAKFHPKENDFVSISATRGTIGYIAPETISRNFGIVSCKSDVYGFGMMLLEMAGGRRNSKMNATRSSKAYFPQWVYDQINEGGDLELVNVTEIESMIAKKLCMIGLWCIQVKAADRPSMTKVLEMLGGSISDLQMPPKPFFSSSQHISGREIESDSSIELLVPQSLEDCSFNDSYV